MRAMLNNTTERQLAEAQVRLLWMQVQQRMLTVWLRPYAQKVKGALDALLFDATKYNNTLLAVFDPIAVGEWLS
jgi:hypothetical protein